MEDLLVPGAQAGPQVAALAGSELFSVGESVDAHGRFRMSGRAVGNESVATARRFEVEAPVPCAGVKLGRARRQYIMRDGVRVQTSVKDGAGFARRRREASRQSRSASVSGSRQRRRSGSRDGHTYVLHD